MALLAQYTPLQRFRIVLTGILLLALAAYFLSIRNTLNLRLQLAVKKEQLLSIASAPQTISRLQQQLDQLDGQLLQGEYNRNALFAAITRFCNDNQLILMQFGEEERWQEGPITYINNPIHVSGSYQNILRLMHLLEQQERLGYLTHCGMAMRRISRQSRKEALQAEIHIQYLEIEQ